MDEAAIIRNYGYYFNSLKKLGSIPLCQTPTLKDITPSRGIIQAAYKQIKEQKFEGSLLDYLCWVSAMHINLFAAKSGKTLANFVEIYYDSWPEDCNNLFRLMLKNPRYVADNEEDFIGLARMWFKRISA
jgi:hypothetical protein